MATKPRTSSPRLKTARDAIPLPSASLPAADLIDVGSRFNRDALVTHAENVLANVSAPGFAQYGFDEAWRAAMHAQLGTLEANAEEVAAGRDNALPSGEQLDATVARAKEWRRIASTAVAIIPGALGKVHGVKSGTSVTQLMSSMSKLVPAVKRAPRTPHGTGAQTASEGKTLIGELKAAQKAHKLALARLSPMERALYLTKGVVYEELKRVGRVARTLLPGQSADFSASGHMRAQRRGRRQPKPATAVAASTSNA